MLLDIFFCLNSHCSIPLKQPIKIEINKMKKNLTVILISLPVLFLSTHVFALGCAAISADIQVAVRDKNSPPPTQSSTATHIQGENCYVNKAVVVNKQIAIAPSVPLQSADTVIVQDTPAEQNPLHGTNIPTDIGNVSKHVAIQVDVPLPYNKTKEKLGKLKKLKQ